MKIEDLCFEKHTSIGIIKSTLVIYGVSIIRNFFTKEEVKNLDDELKPVFDTLDYGAVGSLDTGPLRIQENIYQPGKALRIAPPSYDRFINLQNCFVNNDFLNNIVNSFYGTPNNKFMQVFAYHDTITRNKKWVDGMNHAGGLHFDPFQSLKFATYLTDVSIKNGMTRVIPKSQNEGAYFRLHELKETMWENKPVLDCHAPFKFSSYTKEDAICPEVSAGDLVIFDTDCWHAGGEILEAGLERKCIIFHNRKN